MKAADFIRDEQLQRWAHSLDVLERNLRIFSTATDGNEIRRLMVKVRDYAINFVQTDRQLREDGVEPPEAVLDVDFRWIVQRLRTLGVKEERQPRPDVGPRDVVVFRPDGSIEERKAPAPLALNAAMVQAFDRFLEEASARTWAECEAEQ
jgi:hypothetical protein